MIIEINERKIADNKAGLHEASRDLNKALDRFDVLFEEARHSEYAIVENRDALVLFC